MPHIRAGLSEAPLDPAAVIEEAGSSQSGAIASFLGTVRSTPAVSERRDERVVALEYEAHTGLAETRIGEIAEEAAARWGLEAIVAVHRTGACSLGEPTVVIACSAPHRREALAACAWAIDEIKRSVPIWKREVYESRTSWVAAEG